jgi:hypothetical protein
MDIKYSEQQRFDLQFKYDCIGYKDIDSIDWSCQKCDYIKQNAIYFTDINFLKEFIDHLDIPIIIRNYTQPAKENLEFLMNSLTDIQKNDEDIQDIIAQGMFIAQRPEFISLDYLDEHYESYSKVRPFDYAFNKIGFGEDFVLKHGIPVDVDVFEIKNKTYEAQRRGIGVVNEVLNPYISYPLDFDGDIVRVQSSKDGRYFYFRSFVEFPSIIAFFDIITEPYQIYYVYNYNRN